MPELEWNPEKGKGWKFAQLNKGDINMAHIGRGGGVRGGFRLGVRGLVCPQVSVSVILLSLFAPEWNMEQGIFPKREIN